MCTLEIDDLDGKPRGQLRYSNYGEPILYIVRPSRGISITKLKHFCVNYKGVTLIGFDVRTIILKIPHIKSTAKASKKATIGMESYLCGVIQSTWPKDVHIVISNPNGMLVDDLMFHNSKTYTTI